MSSSEAPLLSTTGLILGGPTRLEVGSIHAEGPSLALLGEAGALLRALVEPRLILEGSVSLCGESPATLLQDGRAAYVPQALPLPPGTRVGEAMTLSARLIGLSKDDAERALSRCRMTAHSKKKLGELTRLQTRLLGLAHGLCGSPTVLLLEDLHAELDDAESAIIEAILDVELEDRSYLAVTSLNHPASRALTQGSTQVVTVAGRHMLPPVAPSTLATDGFWLSCTGDSGPLAEVLGTRGAKVVRSPRASVLLIRGMSGRDIYQSAREAGIAIVELTPVGSSGDFS